VRSPTDDVRTVGITAHLVDGVLFEVGRFEPDVTIKGRAMVINQLMDDIFDSPYFEAEEDEAQLLAGVMGRYKLALVVKVREPKTFAPNELWVSRGERTVVITDLSISGSAS